MFHFRRPRPTARKIALGVVAVLTLPVLGQQLRLDQSLTMRLVARATQAQQPDPLQPSAISVNPTVKPGDVNWHTSFAKACEAAKTSGKPVLLFHMMGQLDRQFC